MSIRTDIPYLYVLAGGQSSRFGSDKALADVGGKPMLQHVIDRLNREDQEVTIVTGQHKRYELFGHDVITDQPSGIGPMGGLAAALDHRKQQRGDGWLVLASCDLIEPSSEWLKQLDEHRESVPVHAIAFRGERWEPMLALYHTDLLPLVQNQIKHQHYSMQRLLDSAEACEVDLPSGLSSIPQANTPEQLDASCKRSFA